MEPATVQDSFIGQRFGKEGQLEVMSFHGWRRGKKDRVYKCFCHKCKDDPELFGDGSFLTKKDSLVNGSLPCGCSPQVNWTLDQWEILVRRECAERDFEFLGFISGFKGNKTQIRLKCNKDGNVWDSNTVAGIVNCNRGCPACGLRTRADKKATPDAEMVRRFFSTGSFKAGTIFTRVKKNGRIWQYSCPSCSSDEYVQVGACSGVFEADRSNLIAGKLSCRCAYNHKWSQAERELQIDKMCNKDNRQYEFLGWRSQNGYKNQSSRMYLHCPKHGKWEASVSSFVDNGDGCPNCSTGGGYDRHKEGCFYVFQAEGRVPFTGYGISNRADRRLSTHTRNLEQRSLKMGPTQMFFGDGEVILNLERAIKAKFPLNPQDIEGFRTEATYAEHYQDVIDFVDEWLFNAT